MAEYLQSALHFGVATDCCCGAHVDQHCYAAHYVEAAESTANA